MITKRQKQILEFVKSFKNKKGYAPSLEEIKQHFGLSAVSTVHYHITKLQEAGYLIKESNQPRAISPAKEISTIKIPLVGTIAAGQPIEAIEERGDTITVARDGVSKFGEYYALRVEGSSMIDEGIYNGDTVVIKKQNTAEDGDTVVALINKSEVTLKKIYKVPGGFKLQPANPAFSSFVVKNLIVQGKVISVIRNYEGRRPLNQIINLNAFKSELGQLVEKLQNGIKKAFYPNKEYAIWRKTEDHPNKNKFCLETSYAFFNEILLLWFCKDKALLHFDRIKSSPQLASLKKEAQKIYSHIFINNMFDWYDPTDIFLQEIADVFNKYDFNFIDSDILGKLYEQFITRDERKRLGQFYTPEIIIDYILDQVGYVANIEDKTIIDISCGSGGFLVRATNRLINNIGKNVDSTLLIEKVINNIYGLDVNPFACYLAETNILIQLLDLIVEAKHKNTDYVVPKIKTFQTNTVSVDSLLSSDSQIVRSIKHKLGKFSNGFDFVVGNPPYLEAKKMDKGTKILCAESCPNVTKGAFDLFVCFIDKGLRLLKEGGKFGYIIPNKFLIANYAKKMREELLNNFTVKEIIDVSECGVFENISVYPVILIVENTKPKNNIIKTAAEISSVGKLSEKTFSASKLHQDAYKRDDFIFFMLPSDKTQNALLMKLLSNHYKTLDNYLNIKWTISFHKAGLREKFLFPKKPNSPFAKRLIGGKSFAGNGDINRYSLKWGNWWINYDEQLAIKNKNHLPPRSLFEQEKLIICQNSLRLRATYDDKGFYCKDTFFVGSLAKGLKYNYDLKFFLALLNSKLLHFFYANIYKSTHVAGGYLHYLISYLNSLPIAEPTKKQQSEIVALVEGTLEVQGKSEFEKLDKKIDFLVYKLYRLSDVEIKIVDAFC